MIVIDGLRFVICGLWCEFEIYGLCFVVGGLRFVVGVLRFQTLWFPL